jgi:hypothetical protein
MEVIVKEKGTRREGRHYRSGRPTLPPILTGTAALPLQLRMTALSPYLRRHYGSTTNSIKYEPFIPLYA